MRNALKELHTAMNYAYEFSADPNVPTDLVIGAAVAFGRWAVANELNEYKHFTKEAFRCAEEFTCCLMEELGYKSTDRVFWVKA